MSITFSTSWYVFKSKFDVSTYERWINNMLSNVHQYYLVVYTDEQSSQYIEKYLSNPRIKMVIRPCEEFYTYNFKEDWVKNHEKNDLLRDRIDWKLNMLWSEKIQFVSETSKSNPFNSEWFGWCDIGYFRGNERDLDYLSLTSWPNPSKIEKLDYEKIYYACVNNFDEYIGKLMTGILRKNSHGLPEKEIPANQVSIAGGFFLIHCAKIEWWKKTFYDKLALYFHHERLVKDDQILIADCVFSNLQNFILLRENNPNYDNWFLFQRYLM